MAANRTTFEKLQRDRAKKLKADQKRARRMGAEEGPVRTGGDSLDGDVEIPQVDRLTPDQLLTLVEQITRQLESGVIELEEFEEKKADLMARMGAI